MREEKRLADLKVGQLHSCGALSRDSYIGATVSHCHRAEKSQDRETPLQVVCYFLMSVSVIWEKGIERKAIGKKRRHKKGHFNNLLINYK